MKIGLYGYEGSGATTLFNAITGMDVATGFSSGGRKNMHIGTVKVPDKRIDKLTELYSPKRTVYSELIFTDFPGGKDSGKKSLANVEEVKTVDILALVVGAFTGEFDDKPKEPASELDNLLTELVLLDLEQVERFFEKNKKVKSSTINPFILSAMNKMKPHLEEGLSLRTLELTKEELQNLRGFSFLSLKPALIAVNVDEDKIGEMPSGISEIAERHGAQPFILSAKVEEEISKLDSDEQEMFLEDLGISEPLSTRFIRAAYDLADLISFFTVGPDEVRSWAIKKNTPAKQAAGTIHSDLEKGFIRAEVFHYNDIIEAKGDEALIKKQGKFRLEGKEYIVKDGDIMHVRFNV